MTIFPKTSNFSLKSFDVISPVTPPMKSVVIVGSSGWSGIAGFSLILESIFDATGSLMP